jgi:hypothetical protein
VNGCCIVEDLAVIAEAGVVTSRYQSWRPEFGVPVRITVGEPKFWRSGVLEDVPELAPWERATWYLPTVAERRAVYEKRLARYGDEAIAKLAEIAQRHSGRRLVLLCFEDVNAGEECHRRWCAEWFEQRHGLVVPELPADQLRLPL